LRKNWNNLILCLNSAIKYLDIIVLTEINVSNEEVNLYGIPGFDSTFKCRPTGKGGGILIFSKHKINIIDVTSKFSFTATEFLITQISCRKEQIILASFYRPPNQNINHFNIELNNFLESKLIKDAKHFLMVGDMNICYLTNMYGSDDYTNVLYSNKIINTIQGPTRVEFHDNNLVSSCLDHINVRSNGYNFMSYIIEEKLADHYWTGIVLQLGRVGSNNNSILTENTVDIKKTVISNRKVNENIMKEDWLPILSLSEPEHIYENLCQKFDNIYSNSTIDIYIKNGIKKEMNPWLNDELKSLIDHKYFLWNQWKKDKYNIQYMQLFKKARNDLTNRLRLEKEKYFSKLLINNIKDPRKSWDIINELINKKKRPTIKESIINNFKLDNDTQITDTANKFKDFFKNVIENINTQMIGEPFNIDDKFEPGNYELKDIISMNLTPINDKSLLQAVNKINFTSSAGPDKVRPQDIRNNINKLGPILIHLIEKIIKTGKIPSKMKVTHLRPIFKSGNKASLNCYRPIGSISVIMKILEHYICNQLKKYLIEHNVINSSQHGFMPKKSTIDLLEILNNDINKALNDNKFVLAVATDLTKAFDLVNYEILIEKLQKIGIGGPLLKILENYFKNRRLKVSIGQCTSSEYYQECGLIQGSILSPLLFNIYVNDLASLKFNSKLLQYADDNIFYVIHKDINIALRLMQNDMNLMAKYFFNNSIKLNVLKTKAVIFKNPRINFNLEHSLCLMCHSQNCLKDINSCKCQKVKFHQSIKHLGITLDNNMRFYSHLTYLKNILKIALFKCSRLSTYFSIPMKRIIYFSLVQSMFYYGISIYYVVPEYLLNPIKNILTQIYKILFKDIPLNTLGIMKFDSLAKFTDLVRNSFEENFRNMKDTVYNMRRRQYVVNRQFNNYGNATLEYKIPTLLNNLPEELRNESDINKFKKMLKAHLLQNQN
jgi:hypothetical protein